jgi:hypothetical protein
MSPAVKAGKGDRKAPKWENRPCVKCALAIEKQADSYKLQSIEFNGPRRSTEWHWVHRKCIGTEGKNG